MRTKKRKSIVAAVFSGAMLFSMPAMAFAEEAGGTTSQPGFSLLVPQLAEWLPMLIGFIILWIILAKFGWPMFMGMIDKRQATIKDSLEKAEDACIESQRLLDEHKAELEKSRGQAALIIADAKKAAEAVKADIEAKASEEAEMILTRARAVIETEKQAALTELRSSVADLSISVAGRLIGQDLNDSEHRAIIERYVAEAGSFNDN